MKKRVAVFLLFTLASAWSLFAQGPAFDTSGDGLLSGTYYFRHVVYGIDTNGSTTGTPGAVSEATAAFGNISFDGKGNYTINQNAIASDSYVDSQEGEIVQDPLSCYIAGQLCNAGTGTTVSGTYAISASGFGFISNPIVPGDNIFGSVAANGVFIGSTTESTYAYNDLFIAALVPSPQPTNSFFSGSYSAVGFFPGGGAYAFENGVYGSPTDSLGASFQLNPNGAGSLGTVNVTGTAGNGAAVSQSTANVPYTFSGGAAVITFPGNETGPFFPAQGATLPEYLYFSPDGNFFFGGSPTLGFDMIVGVRNASGPLNFGGIYYQAGLDQNESNLSAGSADFDGYYGSFNATSGGDVLIHQRFADQDYGTYGWTSADSFTPPLPASYTDTVASIQYATGAGGAIRIGQGIWPYMGINIALQAPTFSGPAGTPYLNPAGIVNAASFTPFTAGVSAGEMVTLFGNNLAPGPMSAMTLPLPTSQGLNGVTVLVNGIPAPINYVSPTQILINVPYGTAFACTNAASVDCAQFQVDNNGSKSNVVTELVNSTTPGVFTGDYGLGYGFAQHVDYSLVTAASPAQPGETVTIYASGLGAVYPPVQDGAAAPSSPLANSTNAIAVDIGGVTAPTPTFAGLTPTLSGLYQIDVQIPLTGVPAGDNTLDISGPDSYATQALIPIGSGSDARQPAAKVRPRARAAAAAKRKPICLFPGKPCKAQ